VRRRDLTTALISGTAAAAMRVAQAQTPRAAARRTPAEAAAGVNPVDFAFVPGHVYRYGANTKPGTIDMTAAINAAAAVCRAGNHPLQLPGDTMLVSDTLDFSRIYVFGLGSPFGGPSLIQASAREFDVITSSGESVFHNFNVDGGNPGRKAGLEGDNFALLARAPDHPYLISFVNVGSTNAKARGCYIERGGYTSFFHFHCLNAGLHALECFGVKEDECTTIRDYGSSQFSGTPNGFGIKLTECACCAFRDSILEETQGIQLNGIDNRALVFDGVYQERTYGNQFISEGGGSAGIGLIVSGCYGGNSSIPFLKNWVDVHFMGNSNLATGAVPLAGRILQNDGGEQTLEATGDVTAASVELAAGTYLLSATVQARIEEGSGTLGQLACNIGQDAHASGHASATATGAFVTGAAEQTSARGAADLRVNCSTVLLLQEASSVHLRAHVALNGKARVTYRGFLHAMLVQ
jgi:hypothetical protein